VLGVFSLSFFVWRSLNPRGKRFGNPSWKVPPEAGDACQVRTPHRGRAEPGAATARKQVAHEPGLPLRARGQAASAAAKAAEEKMLQQLEQRKEFTVALNTYRALERDGRDHFSERLYSSFIQGAVRVGKIDVVERMLRSMKRNGVPPSLTFWQTTLRMLSSRKHFTECLSAHTLFGNQMPADKVIFSCLINAALEVGTPLRAKVMLAKYGECDLEAKEYVLFFRVYVALADTDGAHALFKKLGSGMNTLMLNLLLLTYANAQQPESALAVLQEAHTLEGSLGGSPHAEDHRLVDVVSYNTVMKGFSQAGKAMKCAEVVKEMCSHGLTPDDVTMGTLLDACVANNNMEAAAEIAHHFQCSDKGMGTVMSTLFMKGLVKGNCLPQALDLYEDMKRNEAGRPDIITYSLLIKTLVDQHDLDRALALKDDMVAAGLAPDDIIFTHLLEGCRHTSNHALGTRLFNGMLATGTKPSEFTLVTMLKLYGRCGAHQEAYDLVVSWEAAHGKKPSVIHYTCLMSGCLRTRHYDQAWAAYELMRSNGVPLDETMIATLLPGMIAAQNWDRVMNIVRAALQGPCPVAVPAAALNNAYSQMMGSQGYGRQAMELRDIMVSNGIALTARRPRRPNQAEPGCL